MVPPTYMSPCWHSHQRCDHCWCQDCCRCYWVASEQLDKINFDCGCRVLITCFSCLSSQWQMFCIAHGDGGGGERVDSPWQMENRGNAMRWTSISNQLAVVKAIRCWLDWFMFNWAKVFNLQRFLWYAGFKSLQWFCGSVALMSFKLSLAIRVTKWQR